MTYNQMLGFVLLLIVCLLANHVAFRLFLVRPKRWYRFALGMAIVLGAPLFTGYALGEFGVKLLGGGS